MANKDTDPGDDELFSAIRVESGPLLSDADFERYKHFLDDHDLTEDQKRDFLQAVWTIVSEFVALGFGEHPVQQAQDARRKSDSSRQTLRGARRKAASGRRKSQG